MQGLDYGILGIYILGLLALGFFYTGRTRSSADMFAAGSESPWWVAGLSSYMTNFSAGTFVVWGGIAYQYGLVGVSINLCYGFAALTVGYLLAERWKRSGVRTPAQYVELRFGPAVLKYYTVLLVLFRTVGSAVALYSLAVMLSALMPLPEGAPFRDPATGTFAIGWAIIFFGAVIVVYTMAGGLWAVLMTDVLQFVVLTLAVTVVVPLLFIDVGGVAAFAERVPSDFLAPTAGEFGWWFLLSWYGIHFFMLGADWAFAQRFICVPTPRDAKKSAYLFGVLYLVSPFLWMLPPMLYRAVDPGAQPEQAYILASQHVLPPGMIGLMVAAMFSATASLVSGHLNVFAGVLTDDFYRRMRRGLRPEAHFVRVGRTFTVLIGTTLVLLALAVPVLGGAQTVIITASSLSTIPLMAPVILGFFAPQIGARAFWATAAVGLALSIAIKLAIAGVDGAPGARFLDDPLLWGQQHPRATDLWLGVVLPLTVLAGALALARRTAPGWARVREWQAQAAASDEPRRASELPAQIVILCLALCGGLLGVVSAAEAQGRALTGSLALLLFFGSWALWRLSARGAGRSGARAAPDSYVAPVSERVGGGKQPS